MLTSPKYLTLTGILFFSFSLSACQKSETEHASTTQKNQNQTKTLTVGFQKSSLTLLIAREEKLLEKQFPNTEIRWKEFPAGPQLLEALSAGSLDYGFVGNIPPIFAQSANKSIAYVAYEAVPPKSIALIVPSSSQIKTLIDLKSKKIALQKGSAAHDLLGKILIKAGLNWQDIQPVWLPPADARAAFDQKSVDAWISWDPFLSVIERDAKVRTLIDASAFPQTYQFYVANPNYLKSNPQSIPQFINASNEANAWTEKYPEQTIQYYAAAIGQDKNIAKKALDKRPSDISIKVIDESVIQSQQKIADYFFQEKLIPTQIDIHKAVWK